MTQGSMVIDADDLARAVLLRVVPTGFRLVDVGDERFPGVREMFSRLALRHVGAHPALVGFCGPGQDPRAAALAAAEWAAANLKPNAIQRRVAPGVVVIGCNSPATPEPGAVRGAAVPAVVWLVDERGAVTAPGHVPGGPRAAVLRKASRELASGVEAPTIGSIDVAERALMTGRRGGGGGSRSALLPLFGIGAAFWLLRAVPQMIGSLNSGSPRAPADVFLVVCLAAIAGYAFDLGGIRDRLPGGASRWASIAYPVGLAVATFVSLSVLSPRLPSDVSLAPGPDRATALVEACTATLPNPCTVVTSNLVGQQLAVLASSRLEVESSGRNDAVGVSCPVTVSNPAILMVEGCVTGGPQGSVLVVTTVRVVGPGVARLNVGGDHPYAVGITAR